MTVEDVLCAECGRKVFLDSDHVRVQGEHLPRTEWANVDEFAFHPDCWSELTASWNEPA